MERVYTSPPRAGWGSGPWDDEPDKVQWVDATTGFDCLAVRNLMGAWCGYVGVPESHPWHGRRYDECMQPGCHDEYCWEHTPDSKVNVHGGLTFANSCYEKGPVESSICHVPFDGRADKVWWFGFDTCHAGDMAPKYPTHYEEYRTLSYVRSEVAKLAAQLMFGV